MAGHLRDVDHGAAVGGGIDLAAGRIDGAQDAARGGGFAAAALADQCQGLALGDREADVIDGADVPDRLLKETAPDREELLKVLDLEQRLTLLDRAIGAVAAGGAVGSW